MNFTTTHIRSEKVTIDTRIYTILNGRKKPGEVYLAAIAPEYGADHHHAGRGSRHPALL